jgi:carbon-monoxide dehydrogenase medium subunit
MIPNRFEYVRPSSIPEALSVMSTYGDEAKVLAGGQSLISMLKLRLANPKCLIDLGGIDTLDYISEEAIGQESSIVIGAMTSYTRIKESSLLRNKCPLLPQTASVVGDVQVRNRGTIGGSIAHADPAGDMPAAILALRADLKAVGPTGERWIKAEDFFLGMYSTELAPDEILTEIRIPNVKGCVTSYLKAARRPSDFAIVGVAVCMKMAQDQSCEEISIGITGITDKPYRATEVEDKLKGKKLDAATIEAAAPALTEGLDVNSNIHASPEFRSHLARVYLSRAIHAAK